MENEWYSIEKKHIPITPIYNWDIKKFGFITRQMEIVISPRFEKASGFKEGLACVKEEKKYGYIDTKGNYIIKPQFDDAGDYYDGLAKVQIEVEM